MSNMSEKTRLGEAAAFLYLTKKGFDPRPTNPYIDPGIPDYRCSKKRWAEVKTLNTDGQFILQAHQLRKWKELMDAGHTVFLIINFEGRISKPMDVSKESLLTFVSELVGLGYDEEYGVDVWADQEL